MSDDTLPEPDRIEGYPHPRETERIFGHDAAVAEFLAAHNGGRLHHAWAITGPEGIGKATLAWGLARFLLSDPPPQAASLDTDPAHPVVRRLRSGAESRLHVLRRGPDDKAEKLRAVITVDEARRLGHFLHLSAADGGARVVIIDAADEMNTSAANALLKLLEEPPARVTFLLVCHLPARLPATIRSRCRRLTLAPLSADDLARALAAAGAPPEAPESLAALAGGSVGAAIRLTAEDGPEHYARIIALADSLPGLDRGAATRLADSAGDRNAPGRFALLLRLLDLFLARLARAGVAGTGPEAAPGEARVLARLSPDAGAAREWASLAQTLGLRARKGQAVNLDPAALILDMVLAMAEASREIARVHAG